VTTVRGKHAGRVNGQVRSGLRAPFGGATRHFRSAPMSRKLRASPELRIRGQLRTCLALSVDHKLIDDVVDGLKFHS
jgi:hypothetical protein